MGCNIVNIIIRIKYQLVYAQLIMFSKYEERKLLGTRGTLGDKSELIIASAQEHPWFGTLAHREQKEIKVC